ncbi:MAG TPA: alternative oxidase [Polyangiaceae bacterium]|nr:alternative oxidase [Polyangiaceae bacterium]
MAFETRSSELLLRAQAETLAVAPRRFGFLARLLFALMDLAYGRRPTFLKFRVLEVVARVPYQAWENIAYVAITHCHSDPLFARSIHERVRLAREEQDNEQWHLLILQEYIERRGLHGGWLRYRALPQVLAFVYYHLSWLLYVVSPARSYELNRDFEAHAEREYMHFVSAHPELESEPFESAFRSDYGDYASMADVLRSIGLDEREHKLISEGLIAHARFEKPDGAGLSSDA